MYRVCLLPQNPCFVGRELLEELGAGVGGGGGGGVSARGLLAASVLFPGVYWRLYKGKPLGFSHASAAVGRGAIKRKNYQLPCHLPQWLGWGMRVSPLSGTEVEGSSPFLAASPRGSPTRLSPWGWIWGSHWPDSMVASQYLIWHCLCSRNFGPFLWCIET